jgi:hypothetical protein
MADLLQAAVRAQAPATDTTQDFEVSGFGTPTAAIIYATFGNDANADHAYMSQGFWDGTSAVCSQANSEHGINPHSTTFTRRNGTHTGKGVRIRLSPSEDPDDLREATVSNAPGGNGIRLTWSSDTNTYGILRPYVTVILISANDAQTGTLQANAVVDSSTIVDTLGFTPKFIIFGFLGTISCGFSSYQGEATTPLQRCISHGSDGGGANESSESSTWTSYSAVMHKGSESILSAYECTEMSSTSSGRFVITTRLGAHPEYLSYLALDFDTVPRIFSAGIPTSGDFDPYTDTVQPQSVLMITGGNTSTNTEQSGPAGAGGIGFYFAHDDTTPVERGGYTVDEDGVTTTNSSGQSKDALLIQDDVGTTLVEADTIDFDSTGIRFASANITHDSSTRYVIGALFGGSVGATLTDVGLVNLVSNPQASLTDIKWSWFDESDPKDFTTPTDQGTVESTDGSGNITIEMLNSTLTSGQTGFLVLRHVSEGLIGGYRLQVD